MNKKRESKIKKDEKKKEISHLDVLEMLKSGSKKNPKKSLDSKEKKKEKESEKDKGGHKEIKKKKISSLEKEEIKPKKKPNRKKQKINLIINKPNNIDKTEKELNNIFNLCNLNIREEENMKNNKNMLEFTFGDIKDIKRIEERKFDVKNYNKIRTNYSFHKRNNKNNYESNKISNIKKCNN